MCAGAGVSGGLARGRLSRQNWPSDTTRKGWPEQVHCPCGMELVSSTTSVLARLTCMPTAAHHTYAPSLIRCSW